MTNDARISHKAVVEAATRGSVGLAHIAYLTLLKSKVQAEERPWRLSNSKTDVPLIQTFTLLTYSTPPWK